MGVAPCALSAFASSPLHPFMTSPSSPPFSESWLELPDGRLFWLSGRCAIGRSLDNTLVLEATAVSRYHALLTADASGYAVTDLHSANGSYVNRTPIVRMTPLRDGDELRLGDTLLRFRCTRRINLTPASEHLDRTRRMEDVRERACWMLLADVAGFSTLNNDLGAKGALERIREWIAGMRPLIEQHGGHINSYVGDAIFAWWPGDMTEPAQIRAALGAVETWRSQSPVAFRIVLHQGVVLASRSERGEELTGPEVNFIFRAEKVAKAFGTDAMLTEAAFRTLGLASECRSLGHAPIDGIAGRFEFFSAPGRTGS